MSSSGMISKGALARMGAASAKNNNYQGGGYNNSSSSSSVLVHDSEYQVHLPQECKDYWKKKQNHKLAKLMQTVIKDRFLGNRDVQLQLPASQIANELEEALTDTMVNKNNCVFCILGPPNSGKKAIVRTCLRKLEPSWRQNAVVAGGGGGVQAAGQTPAINAAMSARRNAQIHNGPPYCSSSTAGAVGGDVLPSPGGTNIGSQQMGAPLSAKRQIKVGTPDSAMPRKRQRLQRLHTPVQMLEKKDGLELHDRVTGQNAGADGGPSAGQQNSMKQRTITPVRTTTTRNNTNRTPGGGVARAFTPGSRVVVAAGGGTTAASSSQQLVVPGSKSREVLVDLQRPGQAPSASSSSSAVVPGSAVLGNVNPPTTTTSAAATNIIKPVYLPKTLSDDQQLFKTIIHQLGEHEQITADDNSHRMQWLCEWLQFYTKRGYSVVFVVEQFENLLLGGTDRLLYSVFDLMTQNKEFHFFIVGGCCDPAVFSRMNKRALSRLELKTLVVSDACSPLVLPDKDPNSKTAAAGATPSPKGSPAGSSKAEEKLAAPAVGGALQQEQLAHQHPQALDMQRIIAILRAHLQVPPDLTPHLIRQTGVSDMIAKNMAVEWMANCGILLKCYGQSKCWQRAICDAAPLRWFLMHLTKDYWYTGEAARDELVFSDHGGKRWMLGDPSTSFAASLTEFDCVVLVALHKLWKRKQQTANAEIRKTWTEIKDEIENFKNRNTNLAEVGNVHTGRSVFLGHKSSSVNFQRMDIKDEFYNVLDYRTSFEKLLDLGLVKNAKLPGIAGMVSGGLNADRSGMTLLYEHHPVFFPGFALVNAWVDDLRNRNKITGGGGLHMLGVNSGTTRGSMFNTSSSGGGGDADVANRNRSKAMNPLYKFGADFQNWASNL
ncbi:unnamed protein product [Amoebophrya sp. A120]|nr:unnamed protein product [Amoebophrya sp. A120]|eukprot:GSA120T00016072001.1